MVKTIVTPKNNCLILEIPNSYIGKEIEVIFYSKEELIEDKIIIKSKISSYRGIINDDEYQALKSHTEQSRKEWSRDI